MKLPPGYSISWSGQFEYLERATQKLKLVVPATLVIIFVLLYLTFRRFADALLIMATLPFALVGGFWLMYLLGYNMSIASAVGFIALGGVAAEFGVVMLLYLSQAMASDAHAGRRSRRGDSLEAIIEGAVATRAAEGHDRRGNHRGSAADHVGQRHRLGGHAAHRRADGRRHDHRAVALDVRHSGGLLAHSAATSTEFKRRRAFGWAGECLGL